MKRKLMFLALAAVGLASCNGGFKKGPAGLLYNIHTDKSGPNIVPGDFIVVNLTVKNDADSVLFSTYENGRPASTPMPKVQSPGSVEDGLLKLSEGDSATIKVSVDSMKGPKPPGFKGKYIVYDVKVEKVFSKGTKTDQVFQTEVANYMKSTADAEKGKEPGKIKKYITDNKLTVTTTATGLNYVITKQGSGPMPVAGDTVYVNYVGKKTDGKIFDTNIKEEAVKAKKFNPMNPYKPIPFAIGIHQVIPGWDEGIMLLNAGSKATLVIPSDLAYRDQGNQIINPYTPLVFDVELVKIVKGNPNAPKPAAPMMMPQAQPQPTQK